MPNLTIGLVSCFLLTFLILRGTSLLGGIGLDDDLRGVQKMHASAVPRTGGVALAIAAAITFLAGVALHTNTAREPFLLLLCALPVVGAGVIEDLTKRVSPAVRLSCALCSAAAGAFLMHAVVTRVDLPMIDPALRFWPIAVPLTMLAVSGLTNAINLIDGFNGLAGGVALLMFASIGFVAHQVDDWLVLSVALTMAGSILGFLIWNYPSASIFLGDGGAYFIGFTLAELIVLLITRHPNISAWYAAVVTIYPIFETVFSIYRRRIVRGCAAGDPDGIHLHTLVFRRLTRRGSRPDSSRMRARRNSRTSPYLWALSLIGIVPATFFWQSEAILAATTLAFVVAYVWLYVSIVRFRTPSWLVTHVVRELPHRTKATETTRETSQ